MAEEIDLTFDGEDDDAAFFAALGASNAPSQADGVQPPSPAFGARAAAPSVPVWAPATSSASRSSAGRGATVPSSTSATAAPAAGARSLSFSEMAAAASRIGAALGGGGTAAAAAATSPRASRSGGGIGDIQESSPPSARRAAAAAAAASRVPAQAPLPPPPRVYGVLPFGGATAGTFTYSGANGGYGDDGPPPSPQAAGPPSAKRRKVETTRLGAAAAPPPPTLTSGFPQGDDSFEALFAQESQGSVDARRVASGAGGAKGKRGGSRSKGAAAAAASGSDNDDDDDDVALLPRKGARGGGGGKKKGAAAAAAAGPTAAEARQAAAAAKRAAAAAARVAKEVAKQEELIAKGAFARQEIGVVMHPALAASELGRALTAALAAGPGALGPSGAAVLSAAAASSSSSSSSSNSSNAPVAPGSGFTVLSDATAAPVAGGLAWVRRALIPMPVPGQGSTTEVIVGPDLEAEPIPEPFIALVVEGSALVHALTLGGADAVLELASALRRAHCAAVTRATGGAPARRPRMLLVTHGVRDAVSKLQTELDAARARAVAAAPPPPAAAAATGRAPLQHTAPFQLDMGVMARLLGPAAPASQPVPSLPPGAPSTSTLIFRAAVANTSSTGSGGGAAAAAALPRLTYDGVDAALTHLYMAAGIETTITNSLEDTAGYLVSLTRAIAERPYRTSPNALAAVVKVRSGGGGKDAGKGGGAAGTADGSDDEDADDGSGAPPRPSPVVTATWASMLQMLPGVSVTVARHITTAFPSPRSLLDVYRDPSLSAYTKARLLKDVCTPGREAVKLSRDVWLALTARDGALQLGIGAAAPQEAAPVVATAAASASK